MKNIAIILAGGSGTRMGNNLPKQFLKVAGKQVIEHTIDVFEGCPEIDEIKPKNSLRYFAISHSSKRAIFWSNSVTEPLVGISIEERL